MCLKKLERLLCVAGLVLAKIDVLILVAEAAVVLVAVVA